MSNPYRVPRPNPIDPERFSDGGCLDDLMNLNAIQDVLQDSIEWLCHGEHASREVYSTVFRRVDPEGNRAREGISLINEVMWDLGFRTAGEELNPANPTWKWVEVA
jgi:hypothetical protein